MGGGGGNEKGEMGREQQEGETGNGGKGAGEKKGQEESEFHNGYNGNAWVDIWNAWVE